MKPVPMKYASVSRRDPSKMTTSLEDMYPDDASEVHILMALDELREERLQKQRKQTEATSTRTEK